MATYAEVVGNLLQNPEQRAVNVKGEQRKVTQLRVFSDVYRRDPQDDGKLIQDETKSFPYTVSIWNERLGEEIMKLLQKGARVAVQGELTVQHWVDKESEEPRFALHVDAESCDLRLNRIDGIKFRPKRGEEVTGNVELAEQE